MTLEFDRNDFSVSVVIPAYNAEQSIRQAIDSVLNQTLQPNEIIVVDDGSTDHTAEIAKSYPEISYVFQENGGVSAACNTGIKNVKNRWIAFIDSDDIWLPQKLELQISLLQRNPNLKWVMCNYYFNEHRLGRKLVSFDPSKAQQVMAGGDGLNFSPLMSRYWNQDGSWEDCVYECINEMLKKFDLPIILIPHVVWSYSDDHRFMQTIVERLNVSKDRLLLIGRDYNCMQLKWLISHLTLFIGCRTHATIASLSSNVPTLSIAYSMKARGINKDIFGHNDWLIALDELTPEHLSQKADMLLSAQDEIRNYLDQKMPAYKDKTRIAGRYLKNLLFQKS
jgi:glycosyltransferase involved in cell wall biosynthesis